MRAVLLAVRFGATAVIATQHNICNIYTKTVDCSGSAAALLISIEVFLQTYTCPQRTFRRQGGHDNSSAHGNVIEPSKGGSQQMFANKRLGGGYS